MKEFSLLLNSGALVSGIFPVPIYKKPLDRPLTENEVKLVQPSSWVTRPGSDNLRTDNTKILHQPGFFLIKKFIESSINDFLENIISPIPNIELYITQSWLNFNSKGQRHHKHFHANSILSGVMYFNTTKNDFISFYSSIRPEIHLMNNPNWWNISRISMPVQTGDLIIFNSKLEHGVEEVKEDNHTRISLAFNTWFKGEIGSEEGLTKLVL